MNARRLACCGLAAAALALGTGARRLGAGERAPAPPAPTDLVPVTIRTVGLDAASRAPVVVLQTARKDRCLLIVIGHAEALAIVRHLRPGIEPPPRPMTHDLLHSLLTRLGGTLTRVAITRLAESTFYGELVVQQGTKTLRIDTRPSDAMALALRAGAPIFVAGKVLEEAGVPPDRLPEGLEPEEKPRPAPRRPIDPKRAI